MRNNGGFSSSAKETLRDNIAPITLVTMQRNLPLLRTWLVVLNSSVSLEFMSTFESGFHPCLHFSSKGLEDCRDLFIQRRSELDLKSAAGYGSGADLRYGSEF